MLGAMEGHIKAYSLWPIGSSISVGTESILPVITVFLFLQVLDVEQILVVDGEEKIVTPFHLDL